MKIHSLAQEKIDVKSIATLHTSVFENNLLSKLGSKFLATYYSAAIKSENTIFLFVMDNNELVGFIQAARTARGYHKEILIKNFPKFLGHLHLLFKNLHLIVCLFRNLDKSSSKVRKEYSEIVTIAVDSNYQGKGIGKELVMELEKILKETSEPCLSLTTDKFNNDKVISFYERLGFIDRDEIKVCPNRVMYRLYKDIGL